MGRWMGLACAAAALWAAGSAPARADRVTLANGDVLHGSLLEAPEGRVRLRHPLLGELDVAASEVRRITREPASAAAPASPPPAAVTRSTGSSCPPPAPEPCRAAPKDAAEKCRSPWDLAVGLGFSQETGNTEKFQVSGDVNTGYERGRNELRWRARVFYEESDDVRTEDQFWSHLSYHRRVAPRGRLFGLWIVQRDDFADIELRNGAFAGYEYEFVKRRRTTLTGGLGAGWVIEKRKGLDPIDTPALYAGLRYRHEFVRGDTFDASWYVIPYLDYTELSPTRLELTYAHPLRNHLDVTASFIADYVDGPPEGIESLDTKVILGVRWKR